MIQTHLPVETRPWFTYFQNVFLQGLDVFESLRVLVNNYHLLQWVLKYTATLQLLDQKYFNRVV